MRPFLELSGLVGLKQRKLGLTAPTDRTSIVEELDKVEEEDDEDGGDGRGEGGAEEEDVGRDIKDMTNLLEDSKGGVSKEDLNSGRKHKESLECRSKKTQEQ